MSSLKDMFHTAVIAQKTCTKQVDLPIQHESLAKEDSLLDRSESRSKASHDLFGTVYPNFL
ncbi:MAG: hypothetical protein ACW991_05510 [Candidatus Hodarchaeales archaeon]